MIPNLSPKDLALMIGVSESSLKRWVDEGRLAAGRTAGGHRRIPLHEAVRFIRQTSQQVTRPDMLGAGDAVSKAVPLALNGQGGLPSQHAPGASGVVGEALLLKALEHGQTDQTRGLIIGHFLANKTVASVFDGPIAHAMHRIGEMWNHSPDGIMIEHRAMEICLGAIHEIRSMLPPIAPANEQPGGQIKTAIGGAAPGDPYQMPSLMAATVLMECGYRDVNLGANVPAEAMIHAIRQHSPALVWVSVSTLMDRTALAEYVQRLSAACQQVGSSLVLGGRGAIGGGTSMPLANGTHLVGSMSELAALARALKVSAVNVSERPASSARSASNGLATARAAR
jgi:MerR family transcriptional regulator, light-induced transcriptional regulator